MNADDEGIHDIYLRQQARELLADTHGATGGKFFGHREEQQRQVSAAGGGRHLKTSTDTVVVAQSSPTAAEQNRVALQNFFRLFFEAIGAPGFFFESFIFSKFQNAFLQKEAILFEEAAVALNEAADTAAGNITVTPHSVWADGAFGLLQYAGFSALFYAADSATFTNGSVPRLGPDVAVATVEAKNIIPARRAASRRRLMAEQLGSAISAEYEARGLDPRTELFEDDKARSFRKRRKLSAAQTAALAQSGFFATYLRTLPLELRSSIAATLAKAALPLETFLAKAGITQQHVAAAGLTTALPPPPDASAFVAQGGSGIAAAAKGGSTSTGAVIQGPIQVSDASLSFVCSRSNDLVR